jgi:hypothetical protein
MTLFGYRIAERFWAFAQMALAPRKLNRIDGLRFWKLLGSGHGSGFSLRPNFSRYGLLAVWESIEAADYFFANSELIQSYRQHAEEIWTARLLPIQAHGSWSGTNPFLPVTPTALTNGPIAVLTRATIRWSRLSAFWSAVPSTSRALDGANGLLASIGVGEAPFFRQATFSLWRSETEMKAFAYATPGHREAMRRTRDEGWYAEELFARFVPIASEGTWGGRDPLSGILRTS